MDKYAGIGFNTLEAGAGVKTQLTLSSDGTRRAKIYEMILGSHSVPADVTLRTTIQRVTAVGTSTPFTGVPLDEGAPAALMICGINHSAEPTYTADIVGLDFGWNQRATFRWVAFPGGELIVPATLDNGWGIFTVDVNQSATPEIGVTVHWEE